MIVYTIIFNNYDTLKDPSIIDPNCRYICFSNTPKISNVWEYRFRNMLSVRDQRSLKIMAPFWEFFGEDTLYIDGSMQIVCKPSEFCKEMDKLTVLEHRETDCLYQEAGWMIERERDSFNSLANQVKYYRELRHPKHTGLAKNGWMFRPKYDPSKDNREDYYQWLMDVHRFSIRDQISFGFRFRDKYDTLPYNRFRTGFKLKDHDGKTKN